MTKNVRKAARALRECRSFKGNDFEPKFGGSSVGNYAKNVTAKASRRLDAALAEQGMVEVEEDWQAYLAADKAEMAQYEAENAFYAVRDQDLDMWRFPFETAFEDSF